LRGTMITIRPDAGIPVEVKGFARGPTLAELRTAVGGKLELVPGFVTIIYGGVVMDCKALCNEHGKLDGLPINNMATLVWERALRRTGAGLLGEHDKLRDWLVGPVVVLFGDKDFMEAL